MAVLGTLLRNRRPDEQTHAWQQPNLAGPETLTVTSRDFTDHGPLDPRFTGTRVGGRNLSPHLGWSTPPAGTAELLLLIEDIDVPLGSTPAVHCLALVHEAHLPSPQELLPGALNKNTPAPGVTLLRSVVSRGYYGPEPLKGHGPHRYVFALYALATPLLTTPDRETLLKTRPRRLLENLTTPILARGRITGTSER
ncbi:PEBP family protein [Kitasatospora sp. MMS16-BH015]|uniref:YbhB/YbcL family Raf kinase inhibitor-like protein n=1 Tax=Kitasatospora sp. MMS16-BH015 TaxID=2018025 RepID=UPI000CA14C33|nr:YbhB/YbcL family Raf kinase inhibitor-like protein [Kitasatospora sp. MMS16-BH015]AUG82104.1 PEBP family protein [Kitasatospora sp. MMS16-BH015]